MNITKTLSALSRSGAGRPISDMEILKWANATVQKGKPGARTIRSFKDPSISTGIFFLDLLESLRPGIVDPTMIVNVSETGDYEERRQNGMFIKLIWPEKKDTEMRCDDSEIGDFDCAKDECVDFLGA